MAFRSPFAGSQGATASPRGGFGVPGPAQGGAGAARSGFASAGAALNMKDLLAASGAPYARQAQKKTAPESSPWGGGCAWQYDKTAFKQWLKAAIDNPTGPQRKELYGFLAECFLDADGDRDGFIGTAHGFNFLIDKAASLPRRFGMAPSINDVFGDDLDAMSQVRSQMFQLMDTKGIGCIAFEQWIEFAIAHIKQKVEEINWTTIDFCNLESAGADEFVEYLDKAVKDTSSEQYKSLYEFLFKTFVESDPNETGSIMSVTEMDNLIENAAAAPRALGLAPPTSQTYANEQMKRQGRQALMDQMMSASVAGVPGPKTGGVTFDKFLNWALTHISVKVNQSKRR